MNTADVAGTLGTLLSELIEGTSKTGGFILNPGDEGLLRSLEKYLEDIFGAKNVP